MFNYSGELRLVTRGWPAALSIVAILATAHAIVTGWSGHPDFHELYESARELAKSGRPYLSQGALPYLNANPPLVVWLLAMVTRVPEPTAYASLVVASIAALAGSILFITRGVPSPGFGPTLALLLLLQSTALALQIGQLSLLMMPVMTAAWWAERTGRRTAAGALLGGLIYWKPFLALFGVDLAWRREWHGLLALSAILGGACLLGLAAWGPELTVAWISDVARVNALGWNPLNASWAGFTARVAADTFVSVALWVAGGAAIAVVTARRLANPLTTDQRWSLLGTTTLLVSPVGWIYYLPLFYGPLLAALRDTTGWLLIGAIVALSLPPQLVFFERPQFWGAAPTTSAFMWGVLALWLAVLRASLPSAVKPSTAASTHAPS